MSDTKDLKEILERLKGEVGHLPEDRQPRPAPQAANPPRLPAPERLGEPPQRGYQRQEGVPHRVAVDLPWHENKETMVFGLLASLVLCLGGALSAYDYLVLVGAAAFALFSLVLFLSLLGYYIGFRRKASLDTGLAARVDSLSRRVEALSSKAVSSGPANFRPQPAQAGADMERKVEELRTMIKSLRKAMGLE